MPEKTIVTSVTPLEQPVHAPLEGYQVGMDLSRLSVDEEESEEGDEIAELIRDRSPRSLKKPTVTPKREISYFFKITPERLKLLQDNKIVYIDYAIPSETGIIVDVDNFSTVMNLFKIVKFKEEKTNIEGLIFINDATELKITTVTVNTWNSKSGTTGKNNLIKAFIPFATTLKREVLLHDVHSTIDFTRYSTSTTKYNVFLHSTFYSPTRSNTFANQKIPTPINIFELNCKFAGKDSFMSSGEGVSIIDETSGYCVAEIFQNCAFIHFTTDYSSALDIDILIKLVEQMIEKYDTYFIKDEPLLYSVIPTTCKRYTFFKDIILDEMIPMLLQKNVFILENINIKLSSTLKLPINSFIIRFGWSDFYNSYVEKLPETLCGIKLKETNRIIVSSGTGVPIVDPETGITIAEIYGKSLDILIQNIDATQGTLVKTILQQFKDILMMSDMDKLALVESRSKTLRDLMQQKFIVLLNAKRGELMAQHRKDADALEAKTRELQSALIQTIRDYDQHRLIIDSFKDDTGTFTKKASRELEIISKNKNVIKYTFSDNKIVVTTHDIYCTNPKTKIVHYIGMFNITLNLNPSKNEDGASIVKFENLHGVNKASGHHAPHVFGNGSACLGNISTALPQLIAKCEFALAVDLCIQFLQSVNIEDSAGRNIVHFPIFHDPSLGDAQQPIKTYPSITNKLYDLPCIVRKEDIIPKVLKKTRIRKSRSQKAVV